MDWGLAKVLAEGGIADEQRASRAHKQPDDITTIRTAHSLGSGGIFGTETEAGSLLGTPAYMPPEQANGDIAHLDRRADVFGLGAILCEILTRKPPYVGRSPEEVRRKASNGDVAEAHARLDKCGADAELIALTRACLSPEAIDRPKDAQAVAAALTAYLDGVEARLHQAELAQAEARAKAVEEAKRRRLTLALAATVLLALMVGGGGWLWVKADRDARLAQVTREVNDALNRATVLCEQAKAALVGGSALFAQAREQAQRASALAETGPADDQLKAQVRALQAELDAEEKDQKLLAALDVARLAQAETPTAESLFAFERAVPLFREAVRAYGLEAGKGDPEAVAKQIRERPALVRQRLVAALDRWVELAADPQLGITEPHLDWLRAVFVAAEPQDGWTRQFQAAREEKDVAKRRQALEKLAAEADLGQQSPLSTTRLAWSLRNVQAEASALRLLRRTQQQYPGDLWANHELGQALRYAQPPKYAEAVCYLTAAVALRPESAAIRISLGEALLDKGDVDEAIACFRQAIKLDPKHALAPFSLGYALMRKGEVDEAIDCYRQAIKLNPKLAMAHNNLGNALLRKGKLDEAIARFRQAIALDAKFAMAHNNLGIALLNNGEVDEALASLRQASELNPKYEEGRPALARAKRLAAARDKLPAFQNGSYTPASNEERIGLAAWCNIKKLHHAATGLYAAAFATDPKVADDLSSAHRYDAACDAALAAAGQGEDAAQLDDRKRARLRRLALDWLRADLALLRKQRESDKPADGSTVQQTLQHWQQDSDLAGIRDAAALAKLPAEERTAFTALWADVAEMLKMAAEMSK